jgi:2'-5' RNA ligase
MQSLDLVFDDATDARIRHDWQLLADAGLPSQAHHAGSSNAPHVTLLSRVTLVMPHASVLTALPLRVTLGGPVVLGHGVRRVIARPVLSSPELSRFHRALDGSAGPGDGGPFDAPGDWMPHVTLARGVPQEHVGRALELFDGVEIAASLIALRHWDSVTRTLTPVG